MFLGNRKKEVLGIDIGSSSVKLVQLRESRGVYHLVDIGIAPLPAEAIVDSAIMDAATVAEAIGNLIMGMGLKPINVSTSISGHSVIIRKIRLPIMTEEEMESSIQWEAEQYIPFEISEVNLDFQLLGTDENDPTQMNVLLVAAKKDFVNDYISVFKECGLNPVVIDIDGFAMENAFESNHEVSDGSIVALVNMGCSAMNINVLKDGVSAFTRDITVGGKLLNEELQKRLGLSAEDAETAKLGGKVPGVSEAEITDVISDALESLVQEVQRSLDFFAATASDDRIQKVYITGGISRHPDVRSKLAERLGLSVELISPFRNIVVDEKLFDQAYIDEIGPLMSVAVGLAMRRMGDK
jgi:type IV pilus assembly protein PilM